MKLILIEVDDDETAEQLIERLSGKSTWRIAGWFQVPRTRCQCVGYHEGGNHRVPNYKRSVIGRKYKWRVHDKCGRPSGGLMTLKNLMPPLSRVFGDQGQPTFYDTLQMHDRGFYKDDPS